MSYFIYDGFDSRDYDIVVTGIDQYKGATRSNQLEKRANRDGAVLVQSMLGSKPVGIEAYYTGTDSADAQEMYDTIMQAMNRSERRLELPHAGGERTYTATPETPLISNPDGLNRIVMSLTFVVPEGNSFETTDTTLVDTTVTTPSSTIPITVLGSVQARPFITMTFDSITDGTAKTVTLRNSKDFVGITIARDWVTGDVVTIDSDNFQLYINGELTHPEGRLPYWQPGSGAIIYSDTFTARSVDITGTYKVKNL